jgi:hypothetical protein
VFGYQTFQIARKSGELRASNPGLILQFDPDTHSLVIKDANAFVSQHGIPVAYEPNPNFTPEGHLSYRLIRRDQCGIRKDSQARVQAYGMHFNNVLQQRVCVLRFPEAPAHAPVLATIRGDQEIWKRKWSISEYSTDLVLDGKLMATYRSASAWRLPALPKLVIGCALISSTPAWKCFADFLRTHKPIDSVPDRINHSRYDTPLSVMLGIRKYTAADLANFQGYPQNEAALARIAEEPDRVQDEVFRALAEIIEGKNPKPTFNMSYSLAENPARLAPLAEAMARRLAELSETSPKTVPYRDDQIRALTGGLTALPRDAYARIAKSAFSVIQQTDNSWKRLPVLYVRAADVGPQSLAFYRHDFMGTKLKSYLRMLPVLAICRIGEADDELLAEMKGRFLAANDASGDFEYHSALLVALLKLGQEAFLRDHTDVLPARSRGWWDAVLRKEGMTEIGPNNCMPERWGTTDYLGPVMAPALEWKGGRWTARKDA